VNLLGWKQLLILRSVLLARIFALLLLSVALQAVVFLHRAIDKPQRFSTPRDLRARYHCSLLFLISLTIIEFIFVYYLYIFVCVYFSLLSNKQIVGSR